MGWGGVVRERSWTVRGSQDPEADRAGLKGSGSPLGTTVVNPPTFGLHFLSSLPRPSPLTIHRPKLLHMGTGQDLFVECLSLSILPLFQVTGSLGAGRQKHRSKR